MIQPRTLEIFDAVGIVKRFREAGVECRDVVATRPNLEPLQTISYDDLDSAFPFSLSIEQSKTERLLLRHLEELGGKVERQLSLESFAQDPQGVTAS